MTKSFQHSSVLMMINPLNKWEIMMIQNQVYYTTNQQQKFYSNLMDYDMPKKKENFES